jgi:sugar lactone lactonase YvrE
MRQQGGSRITGALAIVAVIGIGAAGLYALENGRAIDQPPTPSGRGAQPPDPEAQARLEKLKATLSALPNGYHLFGETDRLPEGRKWGAPSKVFIDPDGKSLWVAERCGADAFGCLGSRLAPVLKFDASGKLVKSFGEGLFVFPHGLFVDNAGNVWVTDGNAKDGKGSQLRKFSPDGKLLLTLGKAGMADSSDSNAFNQPSDVVTAPNGDIFVADGHAPVPTPRILKYSKDGTFIKTWGKFGKENGELQDPHCIAMDSRGRVIVCDRRNERIQIFDQDGNYLDQWKQFGRPYGIYIAKDDTMYVANQEAGVIIASAKDGSLKGFVPNYPPPPPGQRDRGAESVTVDATGNLYTGEIGNFKLKKWVRN